jgi:hypothetical protein
LREWGNERQRRSRYRKLNRGRVGWRGVTRPRCRHGQAGIGIGSRRAKEVAAIRQERCQHFIGYALRFFRYGVGYFAVAGCAVGMGGRGSLGICRFFGSGLLAGQHAAKRLNSLIGGRTLHGRSRCPNCG